MRKLLARAEQAQPAAHAIAAGDVVQLAPLADAKFGGMLAVICQTGPAQLRGFLLRPHRGGCREAWLTLTHTDVIRIGTTRWPDLPPFARRCEAAGPLCQVKP